MLGDRAMASAVSSTIAAADRSMSASVVDQLLIDTRIAAMPCQVVPPSQQVPSSCTRAITVARQRVGIRPAVDAHEHLIEHDVVETRSAGWRRQPRGHSRGAGGSCVPRARRDPSRPSARSTA